MKILENKTIKIERDGQVIEKKYSELIIESLNIIPEGGFRGLESMEQSLKLIRLAKEARDVIEFEDADVSKVQQSVNLMGFAVLSEQIVQFLRDVKEIK